MPNLTFKERSTFWQTRFGVDNVHFLPTENNGTIPTIALICFGITAFFILLIALYISSVMSCKDGKRENQSPARLMKRMSSRRRGSKRIYFKGKNEELSKSELSSTDQLADVCV